MDSFAVIGLGRFGSNLAVTLAKHGNQVLAIDEDAELVQRVSDKVTHSVIGDSTNEEVLKAAGIKEYECAIVCLSNNMENSILTTLLLKEFGIKFIVARAITEQHRKVLQKVGADQIVFPERDMGEKLAYKLKNINMLEFIELSKDYSIVELSVPKKWYNKTIGELDIRKKFGLNVLALHNTKQNKMIVRIEPETILSPNEVIIILGRNDDIEKVANLESK